MTNARNGRKKRSGTSKRKLNPVQNSRAVVLRPRLNLDGNLLNGTQFIPRMISLANTTISYISMDCGAISTVGVAANISLSSVGFSLNAFTKLYNEYVYRSVTLHWMPHVAPGVADGGSPIYIGYIDNPEEMSADAGYTAATLLSTVKSIKNVKTFNAWQPFTYSVPLSRRLPAFNVNNSIALNDVNAVARSVQGVVLVGGEAITATPDLGQFRAVYQLELRKMNLSQAT